MHWYGSNTWLANNLRPVLPQKVHKLQQQMWQEELSMHGSQHLMYDILRSCHAIQPTTFQPNQLLGPEPCQPPQAFINSTWQSQMPEATSSALQWLGLAQTVYIRSLYVLLCAKISKYTGYIYTVLANPNNEWTWQGQISTHRQVITLSNNLSYN